jgi:hypothetical protein
MSIAAAWPQCLDFFGTPLVIEPSPGQLSGDAGLLPIRQFDQRIGLTRTLAEALDDPPDPDLTEHTITSHERRAEEVEDLGPGTWYTHQLTPREERSLEAQQVRRSRK